MQIIKLGATPSTNSYLKDLARSRELEDLTLVATDEQTQGRGQMGTQWYAEKGKNLTFSMLKKTNSLSASDHFQLNIGVSLAVLDVFSGHAVPGLCIKWPNDILSGNKKLGGILIENMVSGPYIRSAIIGMGININQKHFEGLPGATSVWNAIGKELSLDGLLQELQLGLKSRLEVLGADFPQEMWAEYESRLFGTGADRPFFGPDGVGFFGRVKGVDPGGRLIVSHKGGREHSYGLKELRWVMAE